MIRLCSFSPTVLSQRQRELSILRLRTVGIRKRSRYPTMETFQLRPRGAAARGFTLIETMVAILVLSVGLVGLASLAAQSLSGTSRSRFSAAAADLATEKLEDLSRWPVFDPANNIADPNIYAASGTTVGSLTSDTFATVTSGGIPAELVNYYDDVEISNSSGAISETVSQVIAGV